MTEILNYWGPTLLALVIVVAALRYAIMRQAKFFKDRSENDNAQTAELQKIGQSLERIAAALEARS